MISVVIPVRNDASTIGEQLDALALQRYEADWEVVVADNGSTDSTLEVVHAYSALARLRVVDAGQRPGASHARNVGAEQAVGDRLLFADADDRVAPGWLAAMASGLDEGDAVSGRTQRFYMRRDGQESFAEQPTEPLRTLDASFLPFAPSGNCGVRKSVFEALGGFDVAFRVCEDDDFFWRLQLAGYKLVGVSASLVLVRDRSSALGSIRQIFDRGRYQALLYKRYGPVGLSRRSASRALGDLGRTAVRMPTRMRSHYGRRLSIAQLALSAGRLYGSFVERVRYF